MTRLRTVASVAALALLAFSGTGCKQGAGDRCELNSDCASGLHCSTGDGTTVADSGKCVSNSTPMTMDAAVVDTGGGNDDAITTSDTAMDLASTTDASTSDATNDTAATDAVTTSDTAAPPADASPDTTSDVAAD